MTLPRPLTPLERALLRAVVELGDDAHSMNVRKRVREMRGDDEIEGCLFVTACRLEDEGYLEYFEAETDRVRCYWRPDCDLTAVLDDGGDEEGEGAKP